jgi:hypothetical protein
MRGHRFFPNKVNPANGNHNAGYGRHAASKYDNDCPDGTNSKHHHVGNINDDSAAQREYSRYFARSPIHYYGSAEYNYDNNNYRASWNGWIGYYALRNNTNCVGRCDNGACDSGTCGSSCSRLTGRNEQ